MWPDKCSRLPVIIEVTGSWLVCSVPYFIIDHMGYICNSDNVAEAPLVKCIKLFTGDCSHASFDSVYLKSENPVYQY